MEDGWSQPVRKMTVQEALAPVRLTQFCTLTNSSDVLLEDFLGTRSPVTVLACMEYTMCQEV